jgi:DNA-binding NarL/FixJ family response regulator
VADDAIRVAVVDDHAMVRDGLVAALCAEAGIEVVGSAGSLAEAVVLIAATDPQVAIVDLNLADGPGSDLPSLLPAPNATRVVIITGTDDRTGLDAAVAGGCSGFVGKGRGLDHLIHAVRAVAAGASVFPADLLARVLRSVAPIHNPLTDREQEVLGLLARAQTVEQISQSLFLSVHTVRNHIRAILAKLGASSQLEAVVNAARAGIVEIT